MWIPIFMSFQASASETDAFTFRYEAIEDSLQKIDTEVNERIQNAVKHANHRARFLHRRERRHGTETQDLTCSDRYLRKALKKELRRKLYGKVEGWINSTDSVDKRRISLGKSIYRRLKFREMWPAHLGKMGFGSVLRVNGNLVGTDKFGHFFDEGYHYYSDIEFDKKSIEKAMKYGTDTEEGFFGLKTTGVKSFADLVANFNGYFFWERILNTDNPEAYLSCQNGKFKVERTFTFADYLDAGWDEGVNCSEYKDADFSEKVFSEVRALEERTGLRYSCPVVPQECKKLRTQNPRYQGYEDILFHPQCNSL